MLNYLPRDLLPRCGITFTVGLRAACRFARAGQLDAVARDGPVGPDSDGRWRRGTWSACGGGRIMLLAARLRRPAGSWPVRCHPREGPGLVTEQTLMFLSADTKSPAAMVRRPGGRG